MNIKICVFAISVVFLLFHTSYSQINKDNLIMGISGTYEVKNEVAISSINIEYEKFDFNSVLLGVGISGKYCNFGGTTNKNIFLAANANLNFKNLARSNIIPFIGISGGTNLDLKDSYYGINIGCRYFIDKNMILLLKNSFNNRDALSPEIGIEYMF